MTAEQKEIAGMVFAGTTNLQQGRGRPTKNGFKEAPEYIEVNTKRRYVEVPDPVTDVPMVIAADGARLFRSEYAHPPFVAELEEALNKHALMADCLFCELPEDVQLGHVREFLKYLLDFGERKGFHERD